MKTLIPTAILLALVVSVLSCRQAETQTPAPVERPDAVAVVAGREIPAEAVQAELQRRHRGDAATAPTLEQKLEALETLVRQEAIYAKAKASGFDQSPEIQARIRNLVIAQFKDRQFKAPNTAVSEREIEAFYQANGERYAQAGAARGAVIFFSAPKGMTVEKQAELRRRAETVLGEARATADEAAFARIVARHSEDQATRYRGGDLGWLVQGSASADPAVVEALFALQQPGQFAPLVQGARGFYVAKLLEKREAGRKPLAEVKEAIRYQLSRQKAEQAERDFFAAMKQGLDIHINHALLESISLPAEKNAPPRMPGAATTQAH